MRPNVVFALLASAGFFCCVPMAVPSGHLIAYCGDLGLTAQSGALMVTVLLGSAFLSRQFWGWLSDRIGALHTIWLGSSFQALALIGFGMTQNELGLYAVAAAFGAGFAGILPAYTLAIRELFPAREASWRVPVMLLSAGSGMAVGGWMAGVIFDHTLSYVPAFAVVILFNLIHLLILSLLVARQARTSTLVAPTRNPIHAVRVV
jgi:MFS family permease